MNRTQTYHVEELHASGPVQVVLSEGADDGRRYLELSSDRAELTAALPRFPREVVELERAVREAERRDPAESPRWFAEIDLGGVAAVAEAGRITFTCETPRARLEVELTDRLLSHLAAALDDLVAAIAAAEAPDRRPAAASAAA